jgi:hypothetical protein
MPVREKEAACNFDLLRKCVRLLDSDKPGERDAAMRQAMLQCAQSGMFFWEAVVKAFREESDDKAEAANRELQQRLEQRESEAAILADRFVEAQQRIQQLMRGRDEREEREREYSFPGLVAHLWSYPQPRLLLLALVIGVRSFIYCHWRDAGSPILFWLLNMFSVGFAVTLFCKWTALQFAESGPLQLIVKWSLFGSGSALSFYTFVGAWPWVYGFDISAWEDHAVRSPGPAIWLFFFIVILTVSKLSDWLIDEAGMRLWQSMPVQTLRRCF